MTHRVYTIPCIAEADLPMVEITNTKYPTRSTRWTSLESLHPWLRHPSKGEEIQKIPSS
ncbi:hypothetical protein H6769_01850 [Candidatus Peribacteria bacterium]|nr:hypothetical protein [Candidatus Peribacteria bacterium]